MDAWEYLREISLGIIQGLFLLSRIYREVFEWGNFTQSLGRLKWKILSGFEYKSFRWDLRDEGRNY